MRLLSPHDFPIIVKRYEPTITAVLIDLIPSGVKGTIAVQDDYHREGSSPKLGGRTWTLSIEDGDWELAVNLYVQEIYDRHPHIWVTHYTPDVGTDSALLAGVCATIQQRTGVPTDHAEPRPRVPEPPIAIWRQ
jgi:hypothetical protein